MFNLLDIISRDAATYYEFDTSNRVVRWKTILSFAILSLIIGVLVKTASNDFLAGALSAQAILVGFSFNVLFYLVANRISAPDKFTSLEHELRFERLSKLSDEVFDNVTYFNLVAILSALVALILLLAGSEQFAQNVEFISSYIQRYTSIKLTFLRWAKWVLSSLGLAILIFLLIESIYTFLRAVARVRFYFSMLQTMEAESRSNPAGPQDS